MTYPELSPAALLADPTAARHSEEPWHVRWDDAGETGGSAEDVRNVLPETVDLRTSGTTGTGQTWRRTREQMWAEAGLLADLLRPGEPQAVLSFAPPRHLFGALATVLAPAKLGVRTWYRPRFFGTMPPPEQANWAVIAVPWTFAILRRNHAWVRAVRRLTILHSTASLPAPAAELRAAVGADRLRIVEVFGSTEAGGIATRTWTGDDGPWELFPDVAFAAPQRPGGGEVPLEVSSPRLAFRAGGRPPAMWRTDDFVEPVDARRFRFTGRRGRLVKINGRRVNLDGLEEGLRSAVPCADLAVLPVPDELSGEHLDLLVVPARDAGTALTEGAVRIAAAQFDIRPRKVRLIDRIDRSETGKLRLHQGDLS
ncbi:long-chain fatty acid--CoA ligase [Actinomadura sp. KC06]|uniref:AMP-binding protein n=1 Tax=Actinomadura sp. KC06 TaxID=2530369 RepID=UPI00104E86D9|nr:AMP-binding protein [Actinomadura sp. KC06]TDD37552.1 long-chain fatty acid--CoA ligase [Actinomadura sp. KC06]